MTDLFVDGLRLGLTCGAAVAGLLAGLAVVCTPVAAALWAGQRVYGRVVRRRREDRVWRDIVDRYEPTKGKP